MMKKLFSLTITVLMSLSLSAQVVIEETTVKIGPITTPAFTVTLNKDATLTQDAMKKRLKEAKLKTKNTEGYIAALEQVFAEVSEVPVNFYTKVEQQGRRDNKTVTITVAAIPSNLTIDQATMNANVHLFLENFITYVDKFEALKNMDEQLAELKKAEKVKSNAISNLADLEKSIVNDQQKIASKQKELESLRQKIDDCMNDISKLESNIKRNTDKKTDAQEKINEADKNVKIIEAEVERFRALAQ